MSSERRLHPLTLVFAIGNGLREAVAPLVAALVIGGGRGVEARFFIAAAALILPIAISVARYLALRYRLDDREIVIRTGLLFRKERHIPYDRIQNIDSRQNVLHRWFDVTSVQVETGAGGEPEASLSVVSIGALGEMRAHVLRGRGVQAVDSPPVSATGSTSVSRPSNPAASAPGFDEAADRTVLHLSARELAVAGFIENRGMPLILATVAFLFQIDPVAESIIAELGRLLPGIRWDNVLLGSVTDGGRYLAVALVCLGALLLITRVLSMVWSVIRLYGYRLTRDGSVLRFEYGLLTRVVGTIPLRRVQTVTVESRLLHRLLRRARVKVATAGGASTTTLGGARQPIAPIIPVAQLARLLGELQPGLALEGVDWRPAHPRAARRVALRPVLFAVAGGAAAAWLTGWWAILVLVVLLLRAAVSTGLYVRHLAWGRTPDGVAFRVGGLHVRTTVVRLSRVQTVGLVETPFDRRAAMKQLVVDTAGGSLRMPYMACDKALDLHASLCQQAEQAEFTW